MRDLLLELLHRLEVVEDKHPEVGDSAVRNMLWGAVFGGFLVPEPDYEPAESFAMYTPKGDRRVRDVVVWFLPAARAEAGRAGLVTFHQRLAAFQDSEVRTERGNGIDEYFGELPPEAFDESGEVIPRG